MFSHLKVHVLRSVQINRYKCLTRSKFCDILVAKRGILRRTLKILRYFSKIRQKNRKTDTSIQSLPLYWARHPSSLWRYSEWINNWLYLHRQEKESIEVGQERPK